MENNFQTNNLLNEDIFVVVSFAKDAIFNSDLLPNVSTRLESLIETLDDNNAKAYLIAIASEFRDIEDSFLLKMSHDSLPPEEGNKEENDFRASIIKEIKKFREYYLKKSKKINQDKVFD